MNDGELQKLLLDKSIENIKKISKIKSTLLLNRMKKMLFKMERGGKTPPHEVISVVVERNAELKNGGGRNKNSIINRLIEEDNQSKEDLMLKETISELKKELAEVKKEKKSSDNNDMDKVMKMLEELQEKNKELEKKLATTSSTKKTTKNKKTAKDAEQ